MMTALERFMDWLGSAMVHRVEIRGRDGSVSAVAWIPLAAENDFIWVQPAAEAPRATAAGRRESDGDLLVPQPG